MDNTLYRVIVCFVNPGINHTSGSITNPLIGLPIKQGYYLHLKNVTVVTGETFVATIIDRRFVKDMNVPTNRHRFLQRYKETIKSQVDQHVRKMQIKGIKDSLKQIKIPKNDLLEPSFSFSKTKGIVDYISSGNKNYHKYDKVKKPPKGGGQGNGSGSGSDRDPTYDDYLFTLSEDEFLDLFFEDLALPNFIKQSFKKEFKLKMKRAGYTKVGTHAKLNLKKTFEHALMRKIVSKRSGKKVPFLDDIDLRYNLFTKQPIEVGKAAMFCMMDVSYSMSDEHRILAKNFYVLLYLFLEKIYKHVELHFIVYHTKGYEVDEKEFFSCKSDGGTLTSSGLDVVAKIIEEKYTDGLTNLYLAHTSDGDNWPADTQVFTKKFIAVQPHFQYIVYLDILAKFSTHLWKTYQQIIKTHRFGNFKGKIVRTKHDIYPALRDLFKKQVN